MAQITKTGMSELWENSAVYGESAAWLESMYETYISDPDKLQTHWRQYFDDLHSSARSKSASTSGQLDNGFKVATPNHEISPREVHDYFVNYARQKHARGFEVQTNFDHEK